MPWKFQSTPSARRATRRSCRLPTRKRQFQSTPSARRATRCRRARRRCFSNFNPRPPRGGRLHRLLCTVMPWKFQSTPSARRATQQYVDEQARTNISIHALREESDQTCSARSSAGYHFNPRPPRGERRILSSTSIRFGQFQSTPSARRATRKRARCSGARPYFNPRPPRGGRLALALDGREILHISIHALREEGDARLYVTLAAHPKFQSTPSARRATCSAQTDRLDHANFNPRPPRGGRPDLSNVAGATINISIHALREEGDKPIKIGALPSIDFNPRPPRGGRPYKPMRFIIKA